MQGHRPPRLWQCYYDQCTILALVAHQQPGWTRTHTGTFTLLSEASQWPNQTQEMLDLGSKNLISSKHGIFIIFISNLSMKKVVCLSCWDLPNHGAFCHALDIVGKLLTNKGVLSWFHGVLTYDEKVIEYWTKFSLEFYLNQK